LPALYVSPDIEGFLSGEDGKTGAEIVRARQQSRCRFPLQQSPATNQVGVTAFPTQVVTFGNSAAADIADDPLGKLGFALPADIANLAPEVRAAELRRIADALNAEADRLDGGPLTTEAAAALAGYSGDDLTHRW
jgi:hypothetical protein